MITCHGNCDNCGKHVTFTDLKARSDEPYLPIKGTCPECSWENEFDSESMYLDKFEPQGMKQLEPGKIAFQFTIVPEEKK